ncbi:hypothetical protein [Pedobacter sp.]
MNIIYQLLSGGFMLSDVKYFHCNGLGEYCSNRSSYQSTDFLDVSYSFD